MTAFATAWALRVGLPPGRALLLAAAVLLGQLSIGWCNDAVDAARDALAAREDKPIARGDVPVRAVAVAAPAALLGCIVTSLLLGPVPGLVHLVAVASGWAYDLGLKATAVSPVPYTVSFGLLPAVATTALVAARWPGPGVLAGAALLGVAAHFANTVADTDADALSGVRGLPQRIGPVRSLAVTALGVTLAALALLTAAAAPGRDAGDRLQEGVAVAVLAVGVVVAAVGMAVGRARPAVAFRWTLAAVGLVVAGFLLAG